MEEAIKSNWSVRQLERQIATCSYSRVIANKKEVSQINDADENTAILKYEPNKVIKDPYMLEFLGLDNNSKYLVAKINNEIVGFAGIKIILDSADIMNIVTKKTFRNKGIRNLTFEKFN